MNIEKYILVGLSICLLMTTSCQNKVGVEKSKETVVAENEKEELETLTLAEQLASEFTLDTGNGFGVKLEGAWEENKDNDEISALYYYRSSKFYESLGEFDLAKDSMKNISPNYTGVMSSEIIEYGKNLFGSIDEWYGNSFEKMENKEKITDDKRAEIKNWMNNRYNYYDEMEGKYCGDKYTNTIFNEAAVQFDLTYEEIYNIWSNLEL